MRHKSYDPAIIPELKSALDYNPDTGFFIWKIDASSKFRKGTRAGFKHDSRGYIGICYKYQRYYAHQVAWAFVYGEWPSLDVDHINRVKSDNRISNLRLATRAQNIAYKPVKDQSLTGKKGVYHDKRDGRFYPYLDCGGKRIALGGFASLAEANAVRIKAEREYWGEFFWERD